MEKSILSPLKRGRLMISPQINDTARYMRAADRDKCTDIRKTQKT